MTADQLISILATITLLELMMTIGLGVRITEIAGTIRDWRLLCRAAVANYLLVPAAAVGLLLLFKAPPLVAAGFLVVAVCPGAPYGPPFTAMVKGNVPAAIGLMVILAGSSALLAPLLLGILLPVVAGNEPVKVDLLRMVTTLALSQFLPLCVGVYLRQRHTSLADRCLKPARQLSTLLNLLLVGTILAVQFRVLLAIRPTAYLGMLALLAATLAAGWFLGGPGIPNRKAMLMATSVRNVGVGLVIASGSFPGTPAVTAATAYALVQTLIMAMAAMAWGRWSVRDRVAEPDPLEVPAGIA